MEDHKEMSMLLREKLPLLYSEARESLLADGEVAFAIQLKDCVIKSCESIAPDDSAFTINFEGYAPEEVEDTFLTGHEEYAVMVCYSKTNRVIGIDVIGCANTKMQQQLLRVCAKNVILAESS